MSEFLLELYSEEIPPQLQISARKQLKQLLDRSLEEEGIIDLRLMSGVGIEKFAEYCFKVTNNVIKEQSEGRCWVDKVEVFEHENNSAIYTENISTTMSFVNHTEQDNG